MSKTDVAEYQARRTALINEDRALRPDHATTDRSTVELQADKLVRELRAEEALSVWGAEHEDVQHAFPGMEFLTGEYQLVRFFEVITL